MLENLGQLAHLLRSAGQLKQNMTALNERMAAARFTGEAGAGQVQATVDGRGELVSLKVDPQLAAGDVELMEDLVCAAVRDAVRLSREAAQKEMEAALGGVNLGGMLNMLGGKP